ncbi:hypothetical protein EJ05DRAFT_506492 [Pseudovirgaria hyperparasitica]|uniref:Family A G protein-coupled receptor-like protein n=1 Tax=Pseudovirgaria hyperparasitica TaxID=470096 RepID=A0A6A6WKW1_9PEZI|nr:uncharacterized protein EJ05DRAFT_506492 [Pseudovirgaria hyperparasitica]KAF2762817.1 hypothetical protein EJ05DRAFT_506492 [Pseudovirgaria hyperparasitica]
MARGRGGSGRGGRGGGSDDDGGSSSSNCDISGAYNSAVIALNVIFMVILLAIGAFSWWKKRRMSTEARAKSPIQWHNFLLSLLFTAFGYLLNWALTAAALCGSLDNPGDTVAATWFLNIGFLLLVWTIVIPTVQAFWIHSGGDFAKFIKFGYFAIFGLLVLLTIVNLGIATHLATTDFFDYDDLSLSISNTKLATAISFIWFFTAISVSGLLFLALMGIKKNSMPLGKLFIWTPGFVVSMIVAALIPCIIFPTYYLEDASDDLTEGKAIAQLFFSLLFTALTYFFLLMLGTSSALGSDSAAYNPMINLGKGGVGPNADAEYKPETAGAGLPPQQYAQQYAPPQQQQTPPPGQGYYPPNSQSPPPQQQQQYAPNTQYQSPQQ